MRMAFWQRLAVLALLGMGASSLSSAALAAQFEHQEIEQDRFIMLAAPGGEIGYKLLILEQLNSSRPCWNETGSNPSNVEPLLLNFDFTGICSRLVDSNGFSIRTAGVDQALQYSLRVIRQDNDLLLVAASNTDRDAQVVIGRTNGIPTGFSRIILDPGWRLTRRAYNGKAVGHVYITYDQPIEVLVASARRNGGMGGQSPIPTSRPTLIQPGVTEPGGNVIPVPSLPPGSDSPTRTPLPPIELPRPTPAPLPTLPQSNNPNLSTILPPPPPTVLPSGSTSSPPAGDTSAQTPAVPSPAPGSPSSPQAATDPQTATEDSVPPVAPSRPTPNSTQRPAPSGTSSTARGSSASATPSRVPTVSNSRGALLRPRTQRRVEPLPTAQPQRSTQSNSTSGSTSSSTASTSTADRTPTSSPPDQLSNPSASASNSVAAATYQVIVIADSAETQDKVRSLAPDAFLTTINGQVVMQVGVFSNRQEADQLQQRFSLEGLPTAVIPVR